MSRLYGATCSPARLRARFTNGSLPVAVYGLGKMGLPIAAVFAETCGNVTGVDIDEEVVRIVSQGGCHVKGEPGLAGLVSEQVDTDRLTATDDTASAAEDATLHLIIVPTLLSADRRPDLSAFEAAVEAIGGGLAPGDVVCVESTVPPGTCRDLVVPILDAESGLTDGEFGVAACPERTSSGRAIQDIRGAYPKIVGGVDPESTRAAELIYDVISDNEVISVTDATTAEAVKIFEGLYRDVNIALANELARCRDELDIDVRETIEAANTQPYCEIHTPGPGVGGHCIPYYPYFLMDRVTGETPLLRTARMVNDAMPGFVVDTLVAQLGRVDGHVPADGGSVLADATVLVLGLTYRAGVAETRASPALGVIDRLKQLGARVLAVDPLVDDRDEFEVPFVDLDELPVPDVDGVVLVTAHEAFDALDWSQFHDAAIVDTRGAVSADAGRMYTIGSG